MRTVEQKPRIIAIVGATSTGKTAFAVALAKRIRGEVVSVDSRQVYRGLNLGTGKATKREMAGVPHHMIDVASPSRVYSADRFVRGARTAIASILKRGNVPILCGGTGFYLDMALGRMTSPNVPPNPKLRASLSKKSATELFLILKKLDPKRARTIDRHNPVRLIRAIEIAKALGHVPPMIDVRNQSWEVLTIGLTLPSEKIAARIKARLAARLKAGMLAEARRLHVGGLSWKRMEELGLEYRYMARHLQGKLSRQEMEDQLLREILRYAKRQRTWFKRHADTHWLAPRDIQKGVRLATVFLTAPRAYPQQDARQPIAGRRNQRAQ